MIFMATSYKKCHGKNPEEDYSALNKHAPVFIPLEGNGHNPEDAYYPDYDYGNMYYDQYAHDKYVEDSIRESVHKCNIFDTDTGHDDGRNVRDDDMKADLKEKEGYQEWDKDIAQVHENCQVIRVPEVI